MKCVIVEDEKLSRQIIEKFVKQTEFLELVESCESAVKAASILKDKPVDLLFLDIEMPEMTGMELLKALSKKPQIILITGKEEYAIEAFEQDVTDYILKPTSYSRFLKAALKAKDIFDQKKPPMERDNYLFAKVDNRLVKINLPDIYFIEAQGDYVQIHTEENKFTVYSTMKNIEQKLPDQDFMRVHRSYIVRLERIEDIAEGTLLVKKKILPIGGSYKQELLNRLNII